MDYRDIPIGDYVTLSGPEVRRKAYLESLGFWPVRIDNPATPDTIVMRRITGPLQPMLSLVADTDFRHERRSSQGRVNRMRA